MGVPSTVATGAAAGLSAAGVVAAVGAVEGLQPLSSAAAASRVPAQIF
jgi:hypothetical protein